MLPKCVGGKPIVFSSGVCQTQKSGIDGIVLRTTLPETNIAPENRPSQKEPTVVFQPSMFRCHVSFREGIVFVCFV